MKRIPILHFDLSWNGKTHKPPALHLGSLVRFEPHNVHVKVQ